MQVSSQCSSAGRQQKASYLRLHIQYCHQAGRVDLSNGVQLCAVHCILVRAVLEVLVGCNVGHHLLVSHKEIVAAVFFVFLRRPSGICQTQRSNLMVSQFSVDQNNNNNNHNDIYSADIMIKIIGRVQLVHLVNVEQCQAAADPKTKLPDLGCESACFMQLETTTNIAIYYYYPAQKLILINHPTGGRRLSQPMHCRKGAHNPCPRL